MTTGRAEAFSDGVFAVAITVLVFGLLPIGTGKNPLTAGILLHAWPEYLAYVVSFLTIGIMWMNHHTILAHVQRVDRPFLVINLLLLLTVVAVPFPTALVAEHLRDKGSGGTAATITYGLVMIAMSLGFAGLWVYVVTHAPALGAALPPEALRASIPGFTLGGAAYVAGTLIAFASPLAALIIFGGLAVYYLFEHLPSPADDAELGPADGQTNG